MKKILLAAALILFLPSLASAQTTLNQNSTIFNVNSTTFQYLPFVGNITYLNVLWITTQTGPFQPNIAINCTFTGISAKDCVPKPFVQGPGYGSCVVQNPPYDYYHTNANNVSCFVYLVSNPIFNETFITTFQPIALIANTSLSSLAITVGDQIQLRINVQNVGLFTDNYTVNVTTPASYIYFSNPISATGPIQGDPFDQSAFTQTSITALAAINQQTAIKISVNSTLNSKIGQIIPIVFQTGFASLPDFTIFGIIQIIIFAALVLFLSRKLV